MKYSAILFAEFSCRYLCITQRWRHLDQMGSGPAHRQSAARSDGYRRGSLRPELDTHHQPASDQHVARSDREGSGASRGSYCSPFFISATLALNSVFVTHDRITLSHMHDVADPHSVVHLLVEDPVVELLRLPVRPSLLRNRRNTSSSVDAVGLRPNRSP